MSLLSQIHSRLGQKEAEKIISAYPAKTGYKVIPYDRDTVIHYREKVAGTELPFKVTFCRGKFATINADTEIKPATAKSFATLKSVFESLRQEANGLYGQPYFSKADCESYEELVRLDLRASMTSGLPGDRYLSIRENIWKIGSDAATLNLVYDYFDNLCLSFYYTVKNPFG